MEIPIFQVDAFTGTLFKGNPAAVCPLDTWLDDETLQNIGLENNLSETAFIIRKNDVYEIRWFTPTIEVDLCGHATLASGFVIMNILQPGLNEVRLFSPRSGDLRVTKDRQKFTLDFPATPGKPIDTPELMIQALGKAPLETFESDDYLAVFTSEKDILEMSPDFALLKKLDQRGVIVTAEGENSDFISRFFAPNAGVDEDPVTGSAHCTLTPYWKNRLNKSKLHALQLSQRGGELFCEDKNDRILISGEAVLYLQGTIII